MKNSLFYSLFVSLLSASLSVNAQCDVPQPFDLITGSNMTIMLTDPLIISLDVTDDNAYLVALNLSGQVVGSQPVGNTLTTIAVWGDDSSTTEIDGALANEAISFQLVDGLNVYDVEMPTSVSYTTNALSVQPVAAIVTLYCADISGCTDDSALNYDDTATLDDGSCIAAIFGCTDEVAPNYNGSANVDDSSCVGFCENWLLPFNEVNQTVNSASILLSETYVLSLNVQSSSAYIVGVTPANLVVGSSVIGQTSQQLALWPNDVQTTELNGAQDGELISFYLIDDESVYLLDYEFTFVTMGFVNVSTEETTTLYCMANTPFGCTNNSACNFDPIANTDNGTCEYPEVNLDCNNICLNDSDLDGVCDEYEIAGCEDENACNYNAEATDSDDSCELPIEFYNCANECLLDSDSDGVCDELEVIGCQDEVACDYNASG